MQVHDRRLEQVVRDLVVVRDGADDVRADVALVVEGLEAAPDARVRVLYERGLAGAAVGVVGVGSIRIDPLLHLDGAGAVVEFVGYVCCLRADVADLADEGHLCYFDAVDAELGVRVGLGGVDELLDCYRAECIFAVTLAAASVYARM